MSRLHLRNRLGNTYNRSTIEELLGHIQDQVNQLSEGRITPRYAALTAAPTTGEFQKGDVVWNSSPSELGAGGSKYMVIGWLCTVAGSPGTFLPMRVLTGN